MDIDVYFKKTYTAAFRLTGDKKAACELTTQAISNLSDKIDTNNIITDCIFKSTVLEVCVLFLQKYDMCSVEFDFNYNSKDKSQKIQKALLSLDTVNRIIIVWRDFLSFQLSDLVHIINKDRTELNAELSNARMQVKQSLSMNILF